MRYSQDEVRWKAGVNPRPTVGATVGAEGEILSPVGDVILRCKITGRGGPLPYDGMLKMEM